MHAGASTWVIVDKLQQPDCNERNGQTQMCHHKVTDAPPQGHRCPITKLLVSKQRPKKHILCFQNGHINKAQ
jgi:hypothetical protein